MKGRETKTVTFIDAETFGAGAVAYTSDSYRCAGYKEFELLTKLVVVGAPTDIVVDVEISDDDETFYKIMDWEFGDLRWEDSAGNLNEAVRRKLCANYIRLVATPSGTGAGATFTLTAKLILGK